MLLNRPAYPTKEMKTSVPRKLSNCMFYTIHYLMLHHLLWLSNKYDSFRTMNGLFQRAENKELMPILGL